MLNEEQLEEIRQFFSGPTGEALFAQLQAGVVAEWMGVQDLAERERCWSDLQAVNRLQATLRDATAMKRLTQRSVRRVYTT